MVDMVVIPQKKYIWLIWLQSLNMKYGWNVGGYASVPPHCLVDMVAIPQYEIWLECRRLCLCAPTLPG